MEISQYLSGLMAMDPITVMKALGAIILVDLLLGGDNAIIIAAATKNVPDNLRKKAIFWGTAGAICLRIVFLGIAAWLISIPFVKIVGGLLLVWIGWKLLTAEDDGHNISQSDKFWIAVKSIIMADVVMSIDNVLAVTGASHGMGQYSMLFAWIGIIISIPIIVWGSIFVIKMMDRWPVIFTVGAGFLGWLGGDMIAHDVPGWKYLNITAPNAVVCAIIGIMTVFAVVKLKGKVLDFGFIRI